jgi:MoaA/NifB/PqqE/SkfB family radical SAM enzyme
MGARVVSLSGSGEPLLYEDICPLIDYIRQLDMRVVMFTNGTLLSSTTAGFLVSRDVVVYVQLPSLRPDVCDRMAGRRNCQQWAEYSYRHDGTRRVVGLPAGLKNLLDRCTTKDQRDLVRLEALITRVNRASLPEVAALSRQLGLGLHLETPIFNARAIKNYEKIALTETEYAELHDRLAAILGAEYFESHRGQRCPVERNPVVWTNGDVAFCSSRGASVGNVRDAPLKKLFARAKRLKRKADRQIARQGRESRYFHTCPSRQHYEIQYGLPCNY